MIKQWFTEIWQNIDRWFKYQYDIPPTERSEVTLSELHDHLAEMPEAQDRLADDPIRNGVHAEQLLNDPLLKACFEHVRRAYLRKFENTPVGDVEGLKRVQLSLAALADVKRALLAYRFNGQHASQQAKVQNIPQRSRPLSR